MFFDARSFVEPKLTMDHFREWAGVIANAYFSAGTEPTTSLCKIAQSEELTPHQISVLAGEANRLIHTTKYASASDKYLAADFPLADAKKAVASLQIGGEEKLAYEMPAPVLPEEGPDHYAMWGLGGPEQMDKTASVRHDLKDTQQKTELYAQSLQDKIILEKNAADAAERGFIKQARQMTLEGDSSLARMKVLGSLDHFLKQAGMDFARPCLAKLAEALKQEGKLEAKQANAAIDYFLSKEADLKAPQELISENLQARVVNGNHPLYITLKTFRDHRRDLQDCYGKAKILEDRLHIIRQKVRAL